ncbi:MAG: hypothetical protein WEC75_09090 [Dehalococcoidia bacterium]
MVTKAAFGMARELLQRTGDIASTGEEAVFDPAYRDRMSAGQRRLAAEALFSVARSYELQGDVQEARLSYESVLLVEPGHAQAQRRLRLLNRVDWGAFIASASFALAR